jgi:S-adenosylmethionine decarboxylase proenzyme
MMLAYKEPTSHYEPSFHAECHPPALSNRRARRITMRGLHCMADLRGCPSHRFDDAAALLTVCKDLVAQVGLTVVAEQSHRFPPAALGNASCGVTLTLLLAESHLCVHTWPELGGATIDAYVCNLFGDNSAKAQALIAGLIAWFEPQTCSQQAVERGV